MACHLVHWGKGRHKSILGFWWIWIARRSFFSRDDFWSLSNVYPVKCECVGTHWKVNMAIAIKFDWIKSEGKESYDSLNFLHVYIPSVIDWLNAQWYAFSVSLTKPNQNLVDHLHITVPEACVKGRACIWACACGHTCEGNNHGFTMENQPGRSQKLSKVSLYCNVRWVIELEFASAWNLP